ncbi:gamma-glutamyltransferase [Oceanobacillus damuensis]|uniref:gamma-glutamyltransferase n=1 Tax=Oceanobacillus damuensis TaxID=937928 RepID=UPI000835368B|nr:gamma-glutamyltransferase [Oceanobacillus damuensis]
MRINHKKKWCGVSAAHPKAVDVGVEILRKGGNAVDAAIAVSYTLGVVEPYASGIGGGGVMLIHSVNDKPIFYDYREMAPISGETSKSIGIPGFVLGMETIHSERGTYPFDQLIEPSILVAEEGFELNDILHSRLQEAKHLSKIKLQQFYSDETPHPIGSIIKQKKLALTLKKIKRHGSEWFYKGPIAKEIHNLINGQEVSDIYKYKVIKREPVVGRFLEFEVISAPPPLAGVTLIQALHMVEKMKLHEHADASFEFILGLSQIMQRVHLDRLSTMGDPDFVDIDASKIISSDYIENMFYEIYKTPFEVASSKENNDFNNTTHFTVVDRDGMMVSVTNTISDFFGCGENIAGFFLNNQMRNFTKTSSSPNVIKPGKRPHSNIAPTILCHNNKPFLTIGSAGGKRIPTMLTRILLRTLQNNWSLEKAVKKPRIFAHDYTLYLEEDIDSQIKSRLTKNGYNVKYHPINIFYGGVHGLMFVDEDNELIGVADPRRGGTSETLKI